jgi:hypothetical protein
MQKAISPSENKSVDRVAIGLNNGSASDYRNHFPNQEYLDCLTKIVRFAIEQVKTGFIHFDNFDLNPEPWPCIGNLGSMMYLGEINSKRHFDGNGLTLRRCGMASCECDYS